MPDRELARRPGALALGVFLLALALALVFQGRRGLWDPDEGRYSNVALQMVDSGDYLVPRRSNEQLHVTKPPLTYWAIAGSVRVFGRSEWSLRLPMALAFALTVALVFQLGRLFVPKRPWLPALIYATSPLPFFAAGTITTDTLLTCAETAAMSAYALYAFDGRSTRWLDAMWATFGIAFLIKGPPSLLPLLAIVLWEIRSGRLLALLRPVGLVAFAVIAFSWFAWIVTRYPGLANYFVGHEFVGRIASAEHHRNSQWYGGFVVYLPSFVLGALPWGAWALWRRWLQRNPATPSIAEGRFLLWWLALPLLVFFLARSRLPFYVLPLFVPFALILARVLESARWNKPATALVAAWVVALLAVKLMAAGMTSDQDARGLAQDLRTLLPTGTRELVFVETEPRYGLRYYLDAEIERVSLPEAHTVVTPAAAWEDETLPEELTFTEPHTIFLVPDKELAHFSENLRNADHSWQVLGNVRHLKVVVVPAPN